MLLSLGTLAFNTYAQDYTRWSLPEGAKARLGKGHLAGVIAYSPDSELLAVASSIGIWIYDSDTGATLDLLTASTSVTGAHLRTLTGHTDYVLSLAFDPDGNVLASEGADGMVLLWRMITD